MWISLGIVVFICFVIYRKIFSSTDSKIEPNGRFILITGCDSGFGQTLSIRLDQQGFRVFAGVLMDSNIAPLREKLSPQATVFRLDITQQTDIDVVFDLVQSKTDTLHALVNNAGVATGGFIDWTTMESTRQMIEVNYLGHVAMTKAFLPLLIQKTHCRVINVSSMCGFISLPGSAAYCASKYALESFSDCLRREMRPWTLHVSIIEPGTMRTNMTEMMKNALWDIWFRASDDVRKRWGDAYFKSLNDFFIDSLFMRYAENPEKVICALEHAITSTKPYIRYRPGWQSNLLFYCLANLPVSIVDKLFGLSLRGSPDGLKYQLDDDTSTS